jgi:hypothetical protein
MLWIATIGEPARMLSLTAFRVEVVLGRDCHRRR